MSAPLILVDFFQAHVDLKITWLVKVMMDKQMSQFKFTL